MQNIHSLAPSEESIFRPYTRKSAAAFNAKVSEAKARKTGQCDEQHIVFDDIMDDGLDEYIEGPDPKLEQGGPLPRPLQRQFPKILTATPIEEIDPYYPQAGINSFVVISKGRDIFRFSASKSLFIFDPFHPLRRVAIYMLVHPWFQILVMITILTNCIIMTLQTSDFTERTEIIFTTVYTFESSLKVIARGFILTKFTYLRDSWNWLDFMVISLAYVTMFAGNMGKLNALRTFRVLRALKTVAIIPGLKTIVGAVIESVKNLKDVIILTCFALSVFALLGLQIYSGVLTQICIKNGPHNMTGDEWWNWHNDSSNWVQSDNRQNSLCSNSSEGQQCQSNTTCIQGFGPNPNYGYTSFDTFAFALLSSFRLMTQDAWENLYQMILRTAGSWHILFFILIIFLGSIYLMNLILAIVAMSYNEFQKRAKAEETAFLEEEAAYAESQRLLYSDEQPPPPSQEPPARTVEKPIEKQPPPSESINFSRKVNPMLRTVSTSDYETGMPPRDTNIEEADSLSLPESSNLILNGHIKSAKQNGFAHEVLEVLNINNINNNNNLVNGNNKAPSVESTYTIRGSRLSYGDERGESRPNRPNGIQSIINLHGLYTSKEVYETQKHDVVQNGNGNPFLAEDKTGGFHSEEIGEKKSKILVKKLMRFANKMVDVFCIWDCCWCWVWIQKIFSQIVFDPFMELFITLCIVLNTLFMAMDHHEMPQELSKVLEIGNTFFTTAFTIEAFLKLSALSPKFYFREGWNVFDFLIVVLSLLEKAFEGIGGFSVLRSFRLLRVFKLAKSWPTLNLLISIMGKAMGSLGNLTFVLAIIMFIFAVMGNQLFQKGYEKNKDVFPGGAIPRWNFTDFLHSFMIVFRVLCGEWIESMWDCMQACGWPCIPFFLSTVIIGNLVVLRLFLALLLSSFGASNLSAPSSDNADTKKLQEAVERFSRAQRWIKAHIMKGFKAIVKPKNRVADVARCENGRQQANNQVIAVLPQGSNLEVVVGNSTDILIENQKRFQHTARNILKSMRHKQQRGYHKERNFQYDERSLSNASYTTEPVYTLGQRATEFIKADNLETVSADFDSEYPRECFPEHYYKRCPCCLNETRFWRNWKEFRHKCYSLVENKYFETVVITLILCSSMTLALEDVHLKDRPWLQDALYYVDKTFTGIFLFEMILKWVGYGFRDYFTNAWCWLDFVIVMVSVVNVLAELFNAPKVPAFKTMKTLRALRPLRAMSRMQGMRVVVNALVQAIPAIFNVLLVCLILWLIFAIMGVQFFNGKFSYCADNLGQRLSDQVVKNKQECDAKNYTWTTPPINFDNVLNGYLALLQVATFKGWMGIMNSAVDSKSSKYEQPSYENNVYMYIYFICFVLFGAFFTLNLFIGVIIDNFNEQKKKVGGAIEMLMTDEQKKYYNAMKRMGKRKPIKAIPRPRFKLQAILFDITTNKKFDMFIMALILLNMAVMCCESYHAPRSQVVILENLNLLFIGLFTIECVLKLFALRWHYFREPWNIFDFVIVVLSVLGILLKDVVSKYFVSPTMLRIVRVVKIGRILRLVKGAKGIRTLLFALAMSLPALFNICLLLFLVMFIYAIFGMSFFMNIKKKASIDNTFNFGTFFKSFVVLFPICTSAGWAEVLDAIANEEDCTQGTLDAPGDCGNKGLAVGYLVTYLIITFFVIVNMYIAVILENYSQAKDDVQQGLTDDDYDMYYEIWQNFDPSGTQFIAVSQLPELFDVLDEPLKVPKPNKFKIVMMDIPICEGDKCYCVDILDALTRHFFIKHGIAVEEPENLVRRTHDWEHISSTLWRQREETCAKVIQQGWREYKRKKYLNL